MSKLSELGAKGCAPWLDFVDRKFLEAKGLEKLVAEDGLTGVTSNPSIFEKAMGHGDAYDATLAAFDKENPGAPTIDPSTDARPVPEENMSPTYGVTLDWPPPAQARAACADLAPVYPPALEAATNPAFAAQAQSYVTCLQDHGEWVRLLNDENLDWTYRAGHDVPEDNAQIEDDCLIGTFGSD